MAFGAVPGFAVPANDLAATAQVFRRRRRDRPRSDARQPVRHGAPGGQVWRSQSSGRR